MTYGPCKACLTCGPCKWCFACGPCKACWHFILAFMQSLRACGPCICCFHSCLTAISVVRAIFLLLVSALTTMVTIGIFPYAKTCMPYWADYVNNVFPPLGLLWIQAWAYICVVIFTTLYALLSCSAHKLGEGFKEAHIEEYLPEFMRPQGPNSMEGGDLEPGRENIEVAAGSDLTQPLQPKTRRRSSVGEKARVAAERAKAAARQAAKQAIAFWKQYLVMPGVPDIPDPKKTDLSKLDSTYVGDFGIENFDQFNAENIVKYYDKFTPEKIAIVCKTIGHQKNITILQITTIVSLRSVVFLMTLPSDDSWFWSLFANFNDMYLKTITERKWGFYMEAMMTAFRAAQGKAIKAEESHMWAVQDFLHYVWKIF